MSLKKMMIAIAVASMVLAGCASHKAKPAAQPTVAPAAQAAPAPAPAPAAPEPATSAATPAAAVNTQADAAAAAAEAAKKQLEAELSARSVHFDFDSADLQQNDMTLLKAHAKYISANTAAKVQLEGNCDERGTAEYNLALGERRAKSVAAFLENEGVKKAQIKTVSYGKEKPVDAGHDESAWAKNRRVDINYTANQP